MKYLNIHIAGKVSKVGFRFFLKQRAEKFNITGSVRYISPNSVFVEACGNPGELDEFLKYCRLGTAFSEVEKVEVSETSPKKYDSFKVSE
nr:acylphosphatase [Bacteroidota bacterium]